MESLHYTRTGPAAVLTVDRPGARNALDPDTMDALHQAALRAAADPSVRCVIVTGAGNQSFCAGGDLKALHGLKSTEAGYAMSVRMQRALAALEALNVPVVAVLNGYAMGGGCELMLAADVRVAEAHAILSFRQLQFGVSLGWGGAARLARDVGPRRAMQMMWERGDISAEQAQVMGLVDHLVASGQGMARAMAFAEQMAGLAPLAVAAVKRMVVATPAQIHHEATLFAQTWGSRDHHEAVDAFFGKRPPQWEGR